MKLFSVAGVTVYANHHRLLGRRALSLLPLVQYREEESPWDTSRFFTVTMPLWGHTLSLTASTFAAWDRE